MNNQKQLWEKLAQENSKYYIDSGFGKNVTEEQFNRGALRDYQAVVSNDPLLRSKGTIIDIGCGIGRITGLLALQYKDVIGTDISGEMITEAKRRLKELNNVTLVETDGETLPIADETINVAFSFLVFQHMKTAEMINKNFDEVYRVLKKDGIFKVLLRADSVPLDKWWGGLAVDEAYPVSIGFKLLKKENIYEYGLWLWLQK